jgi:hypothetical protein
MRQEGDGGGHMAGWLGLPTAIGSPGLPIISTIYIYTHMCVCDKIFTGYKAQAQGKKETIRVNYTKRL